MGTVHSGIKNPNWRGGRSITPDGYVIIRVGKDHHLADVRGYAYEHRIVAEKNIGRRLKAGELVHHKNGIRHDNRPENIQIEKDIAHHLVHHRKRKDLKHPDEKNKTIRCACGCGTPLKKYDHSNRPRRFISGHNVQPRPSSEMLSMKWPEQKPPAAEDLP